MRVVTMAWLALCVVLLMSLGSTRSIDASSLCPKGIFAYVPTSFAGLKVIDTGNNTVIATVAVGGLGVAANAAGTRVYVADQSSSTMAAIDTGTNTVVGTVSLGGKPFGIAAHPNGKWVYVTLTSTNTVAIIDATTNSLVATVPVGKHPVGVAVHPGGTRVYVTNFESDSVSVIDTATNTVMATIVIGTGPTATEHFVAPRGVAVHPHGQWVYVAGMFSGDLAVIDTASNTVTARIALRRGDPAAVAVQPDGTRVYVSGAALVPNNLVYVIDTASSSVVARIPVGEIPFGLSIRPDGTRLYVASTFNPFLSVVDTATQTLTATVSLESTAHSFGQFIACLRAITVVIDIKPGNFPNPIPDDPDPLNLSAKGVVPVAIFTTGGFDASMVNASTVQFAGAPALRSTLEDVDLDGDLDMVLHFDNQALQLTCADTQAMLTGQTTSGTSIEGVDSIRVLKDKNGNKCP